MTVKKMKDTKRKSHSREIRESAPRKAVVSDNKNLDQRTSMGKRTEDFPLPQAGFTLIELLIVVAIILVIVAVAIPGYARAKRASNEAAAAGSLRGLNGMVATYNSTWGNGFPATATFNAAATEPDSCGEAGIPAWAQATPASLNGYTFLYNAGTAVATAAGGCGTAGVINYDLEATPSNIGVSGNRAFCVADDNVVRVLNPATAAGIGGRANCIALPALSTQ
jgi:type IV pilus assembly protein PilA